ncbi:2'-5' RNA ligase family protein [Microbacteriaceae bacterium VKM Ac-2855]|nr:2'-5' RNA ligase family protein [Microbacteriaceae bacterium VKM Ac-2855]
MRSIEVTFDDATEQRIRDDWSALAAAGLPSLAAHTGASNRPHLTLAAGPELLPPEHIPPTPTAITFGSLLLFPHRERFVLAWGVVLTRELDALHRALLARVEGALPTSLPDAWTPHVTVARRLDAEQLSRALPLVGAPFTGSAAGIRFWNGDTKAVTVLGSSTGADAG